MLREPPMSSATVPASSLMMFVLIDLRDDLPLGFEFAQYRFICIAMLFRHNELQPWNYDICDTLWRLVKRCPSPRLLRNFESRNPR